MIGRIVVLACALLWCSPGVLGAAPEAVFARANEAFAAGARLRDDRPAEAGARLDEAIAGYRTLIEEMGISNPKLHYNLGNALMMRGELGRAIASYRRALEMAPDDANLRANLAFARSRVGTTFEADEFGRLYDTLLGWQDALSIRGRLGAFVLVFSLAWIAGLARMLRPGRGAPARWVMPALLAASLVPAGSLALTAHRQSAVHGVVVGEEAVGRKGPDTSYEPSFTRPLGEGVEVRVLERRPGWMYVRLPDGRATWLLRDALEIV